MMGRKAAALALAGGLLTLGIGTAAAESPSPVPAPARTPAQQVAPPVDEKDGMALRRCLVAAREQHRTPAGCERFSAQIEEFIQPSDIRRATPAPAVPGTPRFTG